MATPTDEEVLALDWVMGCSTLPHSSHALDGERILYLSGNVGVVYNTVSRSQTLLRGHRNPVRSVAVPPPPATGGPAYIVSADSGASGDNTVIVWDTAGRPLAALDSPFPGGVAALAVSADGVMVAALSTPTTAAAAPAAGGSTGGDAQSLVVWRMERSGDSDAEGVELSVVARHTLAAAGADVHHSVAFNSVLQASVPAPLPPVGKDARVDGGSSILDPAPAACYQLATTGAVTVLFWVLFSGGGPAGDAKLSATATRRLAATDAASVLSGGPVVAGGSWTVSATCVTLPGVAALRGAGGPPSPTAAVGAPARRGSAASATRTATIAGVTSAAAQVESGASFGGGGGALAGGRQPGTRTATTTAFLPINTMSGATSISALTGCSDGSMILWSSRLDIARSGMLPSGAAAMAAGTGTGGPPPSLSAAALTALLWGGGGASLAAQGAVAEDMVAYTAAKNIKLSRPDYGAGASDSSGPASVGGLNAILLSPCRRYLVVGSEDGSVRVYDMQLRLVAWWDDIDAGPITSLSFVPSPATAAAAAGRRASLSAAGGGQPAPRPLPDFLLATRRSLILSLLSSSFESGDPEARRGTILLEGPDDAVVGMVAYPSTDQDLLLVAVASGCLQLWDVSPASRQLLVVRELIRPHGFAAGSAAAAAAALQAPQLFHPTCAAVDPYMRFVAVGTREGHLLLLDPATLADVQPAIPPPHMAASGGATGSTVSLPAAATVEATGGEGGVAAPAAPPAPLATLTFSPDGLHLAGTDDQSHVYLWRFLRQRTTQVSARATSRLGLDSAAALYGRKRSTPATASTAAAAAAAGGGASKSRRPRPWELVEGDASGLEEVVTDMWSYMGRARAHNGGVVSVCFTPLPAGTLSPHVYLVDEATGEITGATPFKGGWPSAAFWAPLPSDVGRLFAAHDAAGISVLASVGVDRRLVLFDVGASSVAAGLVVACGAHRWPLPGMGVPCGAMWYPPGAPLPDSQHKPTAARLSLLLTDSAFKFRLWQVGEGAGGPHCRKTALAPTFGGSVVHMAPLPIPEAPHPSTSVGSDSDATSEAGEGDEDAAGGGALPFLAFATNDRVVGVTTLPLTGNPFASVGVVAHAGPVSGLAVHATGRMLFTCGRDAPARARPGGPSTLDATAVTTLPGGAGGANGSVCVWRFNPTALRARQVEGGGGLAPYLSLLEGGSEGALFQAICDMFAYAQIRSQGEHSTLRRRAGITLPITELAAVMRALGFYPTAAEVGAMTHEVRGINAAKIAGGADPGLADTVDLPTLIQLFVNHRPVLPPTRPTLVKAVTTLAAHCSKAGGEGGRPKDAAALFGALLAGAAAGGGDNADAPDRMRWGSLVRLLSTLGERMPASELHTCLTALLGATGGGTGGGHHAAPPHFDDDDDVTVEDVVARVLGFEVQA